MIDIDQWHAKLFMPSLIFNGKGYYWKQKRQRV
jgi:hypothetical protein